MTGKSSTSWGTGECKRINNFRLFKKKATHLTLFILGVGVFIVIVLFYVIF
jgi:hypothetical protein